MRTIKKIFVRLGDWKTKRRLKKYLSTCDYELARQTFIGMFSGAMIPGKLAELMTNYTDNPCENTAIEILKYDAELLHVFELSRSPILKKME